MRWLDELQRVSVSAENAVAARRQRQQGERRSGSSRSSTSDAGAPLPRRPDERLRGGPLPGVEHRQRPARRAGELRTTSCSATSRRGASSSTRWRGSSSLTGSRSRGRAVVDVAAKLSPRELDVLRLAAEGEDNDAIAERLTLSVRTIERHLHNMYTKLGLHGKSARAAAVSRLLDVAPDHYAYPAIGGFAAPRRTCARTDVGRPRAPVPSRSRAGAPIRPQVRSRRERDHGERGGRHGRGDVAPRRRDGSLRASRHRGRRRARRRCVHPPMRRRRSSAHHRPGRRMTRRRQTRSAR